MKTNLKKIGDTMVVSMDGQPLAKSKRMLLQVMTEEKATGFRTEPLGDRGRRIPEITGRRCGRGAAR